MTRIGTGSHDSSHERLNGRLLRDGHTIAYTIHGSPSGVPVVVLHGGPGSGSQPGVLRLFDLARVRVIMVDQRGTGASTPRGSLRHNNTNQLIGDLEAIRKRLSIDRWGVVGGSWGAALALAYAGQHPASISGVVLRGLFLTSRREVRQLFVTSRMRALAEWRAMSEAAGSDRALLVPARCFRVMCGATQNRRVQVALTWRAYEDAVLTAATARSRSRATHRNVPQRERARLIAKYSIQAHYLLHDCWLGERRLLALAARAAAANVRIFAVHGSNDPVCPIDNVRRLVRTVPAARVTIVDAGHLTNDRSLAEGMKRAIDEAFVQQ